MKKLLLPIIFCSLSLWFWFSAQEHITNTINGHSVNVIKVTLDGNHKIVLSAVPSYNNAQSLESLTNKVGWISAINGWFFCPTSYSRCEWNTTDLIRVENGQMYSKRWEDIGDTRAFFWFDNNDNPKLITNATRTRTTTRRNTEFDDIKNWLSMPSLLENWIDVAPLNDAMNNDPKQWIAWTKQFICSNYDWKTIYMWSISNVTFKWLSQFIKNNLWCYDAIQLDSWGSRSMIFNKKYTNWPWRNIMDAFVVVPINNQTEISEAREIKTYHPLTIKIFNILNEIISLFEQEIN